MEHTELARLRAEIEPLRAELTRHPIYANIRTIADLRAFMEQHVYAVWDFMSLLKSLQRQLTCVSLPWMPVGSANTRYLINEIVTGEESDVDAHGQRVSHFELYLQAMRQAGCNLQPVERLMQNLADGQPWAKAIEHLPATAKRFVQTTFSFIENQPIHVQAAVFTFGREDLIPGMFVELVRELDAAFPQQIEIFKYYLERHIEVDGEHHSQLAYAMTAELCGESPQHWAEARRAVEQALEARLGLWSGILQALPTQVVLA